MCLNGQRVGSQTSIWHRQPRRIGIVGTTF
jgi:hypothetical protein